MRSKIVSLCMSYLALFIQEGEVSMETQKTIYHFMDGKPFTGKESELLASSSAFLYGYSVFTTSYLVNGVWKFGEKHLERLNSNCFDAFGCSFGRDLVLNDLKEIFTNQSLAKSASYSLRVTLFEDPSNKLFHLISLRPFCRDHQNPWAQIKSFTYDHSSHCKARGIKIGNYSGNLLSHKNLTAPFIYVDDKERLTEGPICNFIMFLKEKRKWVTPKNSGKILRGIGLEYGLESLDVKEMELELKQRGQISAAFAINSLRGPMPVEKWDSATLADTNLFKQKIESLYNENEEKWSIKI